MGKVAIITGVNGQDGSLLSKFLTEKDYELIVGIQRRTSSPTDWRLKELEIYEQKNFKACSGDITDPGSISRIVAEYQPDEFYHLAAQSFVSESWKSPSLTHQINTLGTINCLEALRNNKPNCKFYFAGSSEQFGGEHCTNILNEESSFYPRSPYGISKLAGFWSTINYRESYGMWCSNGILFNHESPWRGIEFVTRKITDGIARIYCNLQKTIKLGNLDAYRDWGDARDYVKAMWSILQHSQPDDFVIATGESRKIRDFCQSAFKSIGIDDYEKYIEINMEFIRPAEVGFLVGDASRAKKILNWEPTISFDTMIKDMVEMDIIRVDKEENY